VTLLRDANGQALAYYVFSKRSRADERRLTCSPRDEARRIAANIAKLPELLKR
jgi:hypothetical protein